MTKAHPRIDRAATVVSAYSKKPHNRNVSSFSCYSPKLSLFILAICVTLFIFFQIESLHISQSPSTSPSPSFSFIRHQWQKVITNCTQDPKPITEKLRNSVTFLPLKDLRYADKALVGHTWFMSSLYDSREEGEVQYQQFLSESLGNINNNRVLCLKGRDTHDGSWNYYAVAWPEALPHNATLMKGLTFVSYNHYDYDNIWHGLSAVVPFVAWHKKNNCELPTRWILYHWGELRFGMGLWLKTLMQATFNGEPNIERFDDINENDPVCFEKAVVMRHNEGGMSRDRRMEVYDLMRCKARMFCDVSLQNKDAMAIGMTLFLRRGSRSFKNESAVIGIFEKECAKLDGCRITVAYSNNLTFCEQVKLMSKTDILVSPHGAQLTNMFLMDRNSSVMEFFPKGWLKLAGVGQYVYHWMASWSGMRHQGAWRDPNGENCTFSGDDRRCMSIYKNGKIGFNETYFSEWARNVLYDRVKTMKQENGSASKSDVDGCSCR